MKAWVQERQGDLQSLQWLEVPIPTPGRGQVRVRLAAAALNPMDLLMLRGLAPGTPPAPWVPGVEFSGRVDAVGPECRWRVGDRVCGVCAGGAFAESLLADDSALLPMPPQMEFTLAACLPIAFPTAHLALRDAAQLEPGETVVVLGAGGAVGLATVQLAKLWGGLVIAVARGTDRLRACRQHGADAVIDATAPDWVEQLSQALGSPQATGIDVLIDTVGVDLDVSAPLADAADPASSGFQLTLADLLNWRARAVSVGFAGGKVPRVSAEALMLRQARLSTVFWSETARREPALARQVHADLYGHGAHGDLRTIVGRSFPLSDAANALQALDQRAFPGKILLVP